VNTLHRRESGVIADSTGLVAAAMTTRNTPRQAGYLQGSSTSSRRAGAVAARYDALDWARPATRLRPPNLLDASADRLSVMLDWNPSEFSRLRPPSTDGTTRAMISERDRIWRIQYIYGIGAHGATSTR
jgi:hypothetical protein